MVASRSSSPQTPDVLDEPRNVAIHNDLPSWCHTLRPLQPTTVPLRGAWDGEELHPTLEKPEDERMLELNDLIEEDAYDECVYSPMQPFTSKACLFSQLPCLGRGTFSVVLWAGLRRQFL